MYFSNPDVYVCTGYDLVVRDLVASDSGYYTCIATNEYEALSETTSIRVTSGKLITSIHSYPKPVDIVIIFGKKYSKFFAVDLKHGFHENPCLKVARVCFGYNRISQRCVCYVIYLKSRKHFSISLKSDNKIGYVQTYRRTIFCCVLTPLI